MEIECNCGQKIDVPDDYTGETVLCPRCNVEVKITTFPRKKEKLKSALEYMVESGPPKCPTCNKVIQDGEVTCPHCGAKIPEAIKPSVEKPEVRELPLAHEEIGFFLLLKNVFTKPLVTMEGFSDYFSYPATIAKIVVFYFITLLLVALYGVYSAEKDSLLYYSVVINLAASIAGVLAISVIVHLMSFHVGDYRSFLQTFIMVVFISGIVNALIAVPLVVYGIAYAVGMETVPRANLLQFLHLLLYPVKVVLLTLAIARMLRWGVFVSFIVATLGVLVEFILLGLMSIALAAGGVGYSVWRRETPATLM
jgi:hypothetical protein